MHLANPIQHLPLLITSSLAHDPQQQFSMATGPKPTIYIGYGSNLWLDQMSQRCPTSKYLGVARLNGFQWLINGRGYANVVEVTNNTTSSNDTQMHGSPDYSNVVYGLVYSLAALDEEKLDGNEGVPEAYTKEFLPCDFWSAGKPSAPDEKHKWVDATEPPTYQTDMLVYIDRKRTKPDVPHKEYIYRMNQGIEDAVKLGVPKKYVENVMRKYIPEHKEGEDEDVGKFAREQAKAFRDESGVFI